MKDVILYVSAAAVAARIVLNCTHAAMSIMWLWRSLAGRARGGSCHFLKRERVAAHHAAQLDKHAVAIHVTANDATPA